MNLLNNYELYFNVFHALLGLFSLLGITIIVTSMLLVKPELVRDGMEAPMHIEHSSPQINRLACQVELRPAREFTDTQRYNWYMQQMANQLKQQLADLSLIHI